VSQDALRFYLTVTSWILLIPGLVWCLVNTRSLNRSRDVNPRFLLVILALTSIPSLCTMYLILFYPSVEGVAIIELAFRFFPAPTYPEKPAGLNSVADILLLITYSVASLLAGSIPGLLTSAAWRRSSIPIWFLAMLSLPLLAIKLQAELLCIINYASGSYPLMTY